VYAVLRTNSETSNAEVLIRVIVYTINGKRSVFALNFQINKETAVKHRGFENKKRKKFNQYYSRLQNRANVFVLNRGNKINFRDKRAHLLYKYRCLCIDCTHAPNAFVLRID